MLRQDFVQYKLVPIFNNDDLRLAADNYVIEDPQVRAHLPRIACVASVVRSPMPRSAFFRPADPDSDLDRVRRHRRLDGHLSCAR